MRFGGWGKSQPQTQSGRGVGFNQQTGSTPGGQPRHAQRHLRPAGGAAGASDRHDCWRGRVRGWVRRWQYRREKDRGPFGIRLIQDGVASPVFEQVVAGGVMGIAYPDDHCSHSPPSRYQAWRQPGDLRTYHDHLRSPICEGPVDRCRMECPADNPKRSGCSRPLHQFRFPDRSGRRDHPRDQINSIISIAEKGIISWRESPSST